MSNTYADATGILLFDGAAKITPVIQLLFQPFNLDETATGADNELYVAVLDEDNRFTWSEYLERLDEAGESLADEPVDSADAADILAHLGNAFAQYSNRFQKWLSDHWRLEDGDTVELRDVVTLAQQLHDGHNLTGVLSQGAWHCDKARLWEFGGWADGFTARYEIDFAVDRILDLARKMDAALGVSATAATEVLTQWQSRFVEGIRDEAMRESVRCELASTKLNAAPLPLAAKTDPEADWSRILWVAARAVTEGAEGPQYARCLVTPQFLHRLRTLRALCVDHGLSEIRVIDEPEVWGPGDVAEELRFNLPELCVTSSFFWFRDTPKHRDYAVETDAIDIDVMLRDVVGSGESLYIGIDPQDIDAVQESV